MLTTVYFVVRPSHELKDRLSGYDVPAELFETRLFSKNCHDRVPIRVKAEIAAVRVAAAHAFCDELGLATPEFSSKGSDRRAVFDMLVELWEVELVRFCEDVDEILQDVRSRRATEDDT
jgi:hypothetical protein